MVLVKTFRVHDLISKVIIAVFNIVFNYVASKLVIFRKKTAKEDKNA